ncbi:MAG: hypothetical protein ACREH9_09905, partial [Pseudomonadota bacterium]
MPEIFAQTPIRFCWLRETAAGHLEADLGLRVNTGELPLALMAVHPAQHGPEPDVHRVTVQLEGGLESVESFEALPLWLRQHLKDFFGPLSSQTQFDEARRHLAVIRQTCNVIAKIAAQSPEEMEVHLPHFGRKAWRRRFDLLAEMTFETTGDGRLMGRPAAEFPLTPGAQQMATALTPAFLKSPGGSFSVALEDRRRTTAANARVALDQMLADYGLTGALDGHVGEIEATLTVRAPSEACNAWIDAPFGRTADFIPVYSRFSTAIQLALRRWLAWFYFHDERRYVRLNTAYALLAYQVARPFVSETRSAFAYDVLDQPKIMALC